MKKIKLPLVSRKKYEQVIENIKVLNDAKFELQIEFVKCQNERNDLYTENKTIGIKLEEIGALKKEIRRLKTLCTKNGVSYKKEEK